MKLINLALVVMKSNLEHPTPRLKKGNGVDVRRQRLQVVIVKDGCNRRSFSLSNANDPLSN